MNAIGTWKFTSSPSSKNSRGYFGVALWNPKAQVNIGTMLRSAHNLGAAFVSVFGHRYRHQSSDTVKSYRHIPLFTYDNCEDFWDHLPKDCLPVAVEIHRRSKDLTKVTHPERAVYILGPEDGSLPEFITDRAHVIVQIPSKFCLNLACAGSIVLYDRLLKRGL